MALVSEGYVNRPFEIGELTCGYCGGVANYVESDLLSLITHNIGYRYQYAVECKSCSTRVVLKDIKIPTVVINRIRAKFDKVFLMCPTCNVGISKATDGILLNVTEYLIFSHEVIHYIFSCDHSLNIDKQLLPTITDYLEEQQYSS